MQLRKTILLSAVLLLIGAYIKYVELPGEYRKNQSDLFLKGVEESAIDSIGVDGKKGSYTLTNRAVREEQSRSVGNEKEKEKRPSDGELWALEGVPSETKLDTGAVRSLLRSLVDLRLGEAIPSEEIGPDMSVFGLDKPELTVRVRFAGTTETVLFGKLSAFVGKRYLKVSDRGVYTVDEGLFSSADKERDSFRIKSPIAVDLEEFESLEIASSDGPVRLERGNGAEWSIVGPFSAKADQQVVADYVRQLRALRAAHFIDPPQADDLDAFGLAKPDVTVVLAGKGRKLEVRLGVTVGEVVGGTNKGETGMYFWFNGSPSVYKIEGNRINLFRLPAQSFRDKHILESDPERLTRIEVRKAGSPTWVLEKIKGAWQLDGAEVSTAQLRKYLDTLTRFQVEKYALSSEVNEPFGDPEARVILQEGDRQTAWEIGASSPVQPGELHPIRKVDGSLLGFVTPKALGEIAPEAAHFQKKK